jgi:hypothetical protein
MAEDRAPTATEKLQFVAEQMSMAELGQRGRRAVIDCPYCLGRTRQGHVFCCEMLLMAVTAILDANEQLQVVQQMDKIMDRHLSN